VNIVISSAQNPNKVSTPIEDPRFKTGEGRGLVFTSKGCKYKMWQWLSLQGDIFLEIPPGTAVTKYLGFTPGNSRESAADLANPKYLVTSYQASRCRLEEIDIAGLNPFRQSQLTLTPA